MVIVNNSFAPQQTVAENINRFIVVKDPISKAQCFSSIVPLEGGLVKAVVDIKREIVALNADMHADLEQYLLENGSSQEDLWGINFYPSLEMKDWVEFDSMINIRPRQGNRTRSVDSQETQATIIAIVDKLFI